MEITKEQIKKETLSTMDSAYNNLCEIITPINVTKLSYKEKSLFIENDGFGKAWVQIKKIVESHQYLMNNSRGRK